jgi:5-methylcytosine-specific restriction endonuclease McrA
MSHGPSRIPSKDKCIYCGKIEVELTDEHFLPLSLGGQHIIEKASCLECADITKKFEQDVAREMWGDARISYNAPSRRKKQRPRYIKLQDPERSGRTVKVPYSEYPAALIF